MAIQYLTVEELIQVAEQATGKLVEIRDYGLLDAAAHRPQASAFGQDAYPTLHEKAAALLESIARNHALVDGNKRTAWLATYVFYRCNGCVLDAPTDEAFALVLDVAVGARPVFESARALAGWARPA